MQRDLIAANRKAVALGLPHRVLDLPEVVEAHERFIAYAGFDRDGLGSADLYDLFYWESRAGRWETLRMQECDLSHRLFLPFNQRRLIEALQAQPFEQRIDKSALRRFVQERPLVPRGASGA